MYMHLHCFTIMRDCLPAPVQIWQESRLTDMRHMADDACSPFSARDAWCTVVATIKQASDCFAVGGGHCWPDLLSPLQQLLVHSLVFAQRQAWFPQGTE